MNRHQRMVVKVGSQVLCDPEGHLDADILAGLVSQLAELRSGGWQVLLVSSGAVAAGSGLVGPQSGLANPVIRKQVLAAAGQARLMETYRRLFRRHDLDVAQVLATKSDFQSRAHYLNMRGCIEGVLEAGLVPVINENDVVSVTELMFTDNDELAGLVAGMVDADRLVILSAVPGVYGEDDRVIARWDEESHNASALVRDGTSAHGRGGMHSKLAVARKTAGLGTEVVIADGRRPGILGSLEDHGTTFPARGTASPAKRWLAAMDDHALGAVTINAGAEAALLDDSLLTSLLPVGVTEIKGDFQRGDVIQVRAEDGRVLGCGRAQYDHDEAKAAIGQHDHKPLIHYDYLYLVD